MSISAPSSHIDIEGLRLFSKCVPANEVKSCPRNSSVDAAAVEPITDGAKSFLGAAGASQQNLGATRSGGSVKWGGRRDRAGCSARASRTSRAPGCELSPHSDQSATGLGSASVTATAGRFPVSPTTGCSEESLLCAARDRHSGDGGDCSLDCSLRFRPASSHSHKPTVSPPPLARRFIHCKSHVWPFFGLVNLLMH